ncbi:hypothetical protein L1887_18290 [Cichorium endivia]|nr:hypothetical protein L1887_18290 [Cichorium endivia]
MRPEAVAEWMSMEEIKKEARITSVAFRFLHPRPDFLESKSLHLLSLKDVVLKKRRNSFRRVTAEKKSPTGNSLISHMKLTLEHHKNYEFLLGIDSYEACVHGVTVVGRDEMKR